MIRSMTGFARRERTGPWGTLACEIRSVNHRYLELSLRLPEDLRALEGDARQLISGALRRGKVDVGLYLRGQPAQTGGYIRTHVCVNRAGRWSLVAPLLVPAPTATAATRSPKRTEGRLSAAQRQ